jgi:hypothetical protein
MPATRTSTRAGSRRAMPATAKPARAEPRCRSGPRPRPVRAPASDPGVGADHARDSHAHPRRIPL